MHRISAFAGEMGLVLGQLKVDGKSNEITAIPQLLEVLDIAGATVTLDAMGCQSKVVAKIVAREADYVIGLKGNQGKLNDDVRLLFADKPATMAFAMGEELGYWPWSYRETPMYDHRRYSMAQGAPSPLESAA